MMKSAQINVTGKVQGVWFRASTKDRADALGLFGTVKNLNNGSVQLNLEGNRAAFDKMVVWLHEGPILAKVSKVEIEEQPFKGFTSFEVIYK